VSVVLDSSATLAWLYSDELTAATQQVFDRVITSRAWVPTLWRLEVGNSLHTWRSGAGALRHSFMTRHAPISRF